MFWAATLTRLWTQSSTAVRREVNGGHTTISGPASSARGRNSARKASVSSAVLFIFQFAASSGTRSAISQGLHAGQIPSLHQFKRRAAPRRDPVDGVRKTELLKGRNRVTPADHGVTGGCCDRLGERSRPARERLELEGAHRAIPEDSAGAPDPLAEVGDRVAADVEPHPALGHVDAVEQPGLGVRIELPPEAQILGQLEDRVTALGLLQEAPRRLHPLILDQRIAGVPALGLEEAEAHR